MHYAISATLGPTYPDPRHAFLSSSPTCESRRATPLTMMLFSRCSAVRGRRRGAKTRAAVRPTATKRSPVTQCDLACKTLRRRGGLTGLDHALKSRHFFFG